MGDRQVKGDVVKKLAQERVLFLPACIVYPEMGTGQQPYRRRRGHEAGHADDINVAGVRPRECEQGLQGLPGKTAFVLAPRVAFFI